MIQNDCFYIFNKTAHLKKTTTNDSTMVESYIDTEAHEGDDTLVTGQTNTRETDCSNEDSEHYSHVPIDEDHRCVFCECNYFHDGGCCKVVTIDNSTFKVCIPCCDNGITIEKTNCANPNCKIKDLLVTVESSNCPFCDKYCHFDCFFSVIDKSNTQTHACPICVKNDDLELILATTQEENKAKGKKKGTKGTTKKRTLPARGKASNRKSQRKNQSYKTPRKDSKFSLSLTRQGELRSIQDSSKKMTATVLIIYSKNEKQVPPFNFILPLVFIPTNEEEK